MRPPVVVGVDGSADSAVAAHYAASLAARRQSPLKLVHAYESIYWLGPLIVGDSYTAVDAELRVAGERRLSEVTAEVHQTHPHLQISHRLVRSPAPHVLIDESRHAEATVVGSRGAGGFAGLLLGSVSSQVAAHGHGTVIVVRPATAPDGPVLVGYDGSQASVGALNFAAEEAHVRNVPLIVANVHGGRLSDAPQSRSSQLLADAQEMSARQHPNLMVEMLSIRSRHAGEVLVKESASAGLTVVGCRGHGGFAGLLLGSVSQALVHHGASPIAVIHSH
jgi:nucleotide-binding universal stress UspA family protein